MHNLNIITSLFLIAILNFSCSENNLLELEVENLYLSASCPNEDCFADGNLYGNSLKNIISFRIKNNSKYTYILLSTCFSNFNDDIGCSFANTFPMPYAGLSINNFLFKDLETGNPVKSSYSHYHEDDFSEHNNSIIIDYYKKMGYFEEHDFNLIYKKFIQESVIVVPAGETVFLERFLFLPCNIPSSQTSYECVLLNKNGNYSASLVIKSDTTKVKGDLPRDMLKTFEKNGYKFFVGKLVSNEIPVLLKE